MAPSENAIGVIETRGIVALTAGIEAMIKTADVECVHVERISSGYFAAAIQGTIASVRQALDSGSAAVKQYGELRAAQLYPRPAAASARLLDKGMGDALASGDGPRTLAKGPS